MKKYIGYIFSVIYMAFIYFLSEWIDYSPIIIIALFVLYGITFSAIDYFMSEEVVEG